MPDDIPPPQEAQKKKLKGQENGWLHSRDCENVRQRQNGSQRESV